jgi:hypothetical protein
LISITVFSKSGMDLIMFHYDFNSEIETILSLEGKIIRDIELRDGVVVGLLKSDVKGDG